MITKDVRCDGFAGRPVFRAQTLDEDSPWFNLAITDAHHPPLQIQFPKNRIPDLIAALEEVGGEEVARDTSRL